MSGVGRGRNTVSKRFFFEKKNQKTFAKLDRAGVTAWGPVEPKVFWLLFFKKVTAFFLTFLQDFIPLSE
jgi:hypothetical protein